MTKATRAMKACRRSARYERCVRGVKKGASGSKARKMGLAAAVCTVSVCGGKVRHPGGQ
jgi:hypothetical protein